MAARFGVTKECVYQWLWKLGIRKPKVRPVRREDVLLDGVPDQRKAYFVGFMLADGSVSAAETHGRHTAVRASQSDEAFMQAWRAYLGCGSLHVRAAGGTRRLAHVTWGVRSNRLALWLARYGVVPRKSTLPTVLHDFGPELARHAIRGFFDGDGWVVSALGHVGFCGPASLVRSVHDQLVRYAGVAGEPHARVQHQIGETFQTVAGAITPTVNTVSMTYARRSDVIAIRDYLYAGAALWLPRKRELLYSLPAPKPLGRPRSVSLRRSA